MGKVLTRMISMQRWQKEFQNCITSLNELATLLKLDKHQLADHVATPFSIRVPRAFLSRMATGDINDPLLQQVLFQPEENITVLGYSDDPLEETQHNPLPGLLHKYPSRVLLTVTQSCAIHCRYCFRRTFDYKENIPSTNKLNAIFEYIQSDGNINEVILSGGDPLTLADKRIDFILSKLESIKQIKTVRFHTRVPIVLPSRITDILLSRFKQSSLKIVMVFHINHPNEIDQDIINICNDLKTHHVTLFNQSVLLKNINDSVDVLEKLSHQLFRAGILPYYLHQLDKVTGTHHFNVNFEKAKQLYTKLQEKLPGYLLPRWVQEQPHKKHKTLLSVSP